MAFARTFSLIGLDPGFRVLQLRMIEVLDLGSYGWLAENSHTRFSFRFTDDGQPIDVFPMLDIELQIFKRLPNETCEDLNVIHWELLVIHGSLRFRQRRGKIYQ